MSEPGPDTLPGGPTDAELLIAHRSGDPHAFGTLFARHRDRLWAVALRTTGDPEEAADALQDAIVSAFTRADSFRGEAKVTTWLHRIVVNACLDRLRRAKVRRADPLPDDHDEPTTHTGDDPETMAEAGDRRSVVLAALQQLKPEHRAALVLVDMEGWSVQEAATALGVPVGTVKSRCARGRSRLAALLSGTAADPHASEPSTHTAPIVEGGVG